jgi:hypothetical protein
MHARAAPSPPPHLSTIRIGELPAGQGAQRWLIEELWGVSCVGLIGGSPKVGKSWLGLDMAVSVATGTPCMGAFRVNEPGPVLVYLAEDALPVVRERVAGLARQRGLVLDGMDVHVITEPALRLDREPDRSRLMASAAALAPRLILLDPLVRLHAAHENDATEIAQLLSYFRDLQRRLETAVILVHHTRKNGGGGANAGQSLRGSSDFWAWSDCNLYLRRVKDEVVLSMEHRAAPASKPVSLKLVTTDPQAIHLQVVVTAAAQNESGGHGPDTAADLPQSVIEVLGQAPALTRNELRSRLGVKNERLGQVLIELTRQGKVERTSAGWQRKAAQG